MVLELEALINAHYHELSENDLQILAYIVKNKESVHKMTIMEVAKLTLTSKSTILRLTKKLGFSGYSEFKYSLRHEKNKEATNLNEIKYMDLLSKDIEATNKLFHQTDIEPIVLALQQADRIFCYGTGWGQRDVLSSFRRSMVPLGKFPIELPSLTELEMATNNSLTLNDLVVVVSLSGDIIEAENLMNLLVLKQIPILSITSFRNNNMASKATFNLYFQTTPVMIKSEEIYSFLPLYVTMDLLHRVYADYTMTKNKEE
ncbi:MurR/RpiR family transcriptional regulator [Desemzia sp. RIT 804]|uniref:MurR/RpiR family transcriptional regulator n=1 Tax=Desemzia sp. RIT 804 TaxID=2810209 RepID=UPI001F16E1A5|nr:MurR/RpiR family transcriptional regulator [Desemzia sp. RIT 804]